MNTPALRELSIAHLRGSVAPFSIPFEEKKKLTLVYGENGTGKSTICDAFDFLGNGRVGSLDKRGLGRPNRYWPSLGKSSTDISVTLETADGGTCNASLANTEVVVTPAGNRPRVEVLRRSQILALVEAKPGERYSAISRFVDVSEAEASEKNLRLLIQNLKQNRDTSVARIQANEDAINQFWETAGSPGTDALLWAKSEANRDPGSTDEEITGLAAIQLAHSRLSAYSAKLTAAANALGTATREEGEARAALGRCSASAASDAREVVGILNSAQAYYHAHSAPEACPLCDSSENAANLGSRIDDRLSALSGLQLAIDRLDGCSNALRLAREKMGALRKSFEEDRAAFEQALLALPVSDDISPCSTSCPDELEKLSAWLEETKAPLLSWNEAEASRRDSKRFVDTLKKALATYLENTESEKRLDVLIPNLVRAHEIVVEERQKFTDSILSSIASEVGRLYECVHPGEGLDKISLELDPRKRASLEIGASFCGRAGAPPQAYFSDSHLDTLGLCVFLALAALDKPADTILVLDDVLASVDEPHVDRLIEMLYAETGRFRHCVITTHYRPWKQKFRWGWLKSGQCQFVELSKWTSAEGLVLIRSIPDAARLCALIGESPPDPQLVCAKAGVILEAALTFLSQLYETKIPNRASGLYSLGDLLPSINKKLRGALSVEILGVDGNGEPIYQSAELGPILDELERIAQARNVFGCHFNELSFDLLESDAIAFGQQVLRLIDALADPNAGWPRSSKSGKYWATTGETRRLHPLNSPK